MIFLDLHFKDALYIRSIKMKDVKLTYFESKGRAELARLILAYGGVRYTMFIGMSFGQGQDRDFLSSYSESIMN